MDIDEHNESAYKLRYQSQTIRLRDLEEEYASRGVALDDLANQIARLKAVSEGKISDLKKCCDVLKTDLDREKKKTCEFAGLQASLHSQTDRLSQLCKKYSMRGEEIDRLEGQISILRSNFNERSEQSTTQIKELSSTVESQEKRYSILDDICGDLKEQIKVVENELQSTNDALETVTLELQRASREVLQKNAEIQSLSQSVADKDQIISTQSTGIDDGLLKLSILNARHEDLEIEAALESMCNSLVNSFHLSSMREVELKNDFLKEKVMNLSRDKDTLSTHVLENEVKASVEILVNRIETSSLTRSIDQLKTETVQLSYDLEIAAQTAQSEEKKRTEIDIQFSLSTLISNVVSSCLEESILSLSIERNDKLQEIIRQEVIIEDLREQSFQDSESIKLRDRLIEEKETIRVALQNTLVTENKASRLSQKALEDKNLALSTEITGCKDSLTFCEKVLELKSQEIKSLIDEHESFKVKTLTKTVTDDYHSKNQRLPEEVGDYQRLPEISYDTPEYTPSNLYEEDFEAPCTLKSILLSSTDFDNKGLQRCEPGKQVAKYSLLCPFLLNKIF